MLDHADSLIEIRPKGLEDVIVPRFADNADDLGLRGKQSLKLRIVCDRAPWPAGRPEGDERRSAEIEFLFGAVEELVVLGIGARPSTLNVIDPKFVEQ